MARTKPAPHDIQTFAITTPAAGDVLQYNGTNWTNAPTGVGGTAAGTTYDNITSGLAATDVQAAIDEVVANGGGAGGTAASTTYDNLTSGLIATDVQGAIDEVVANGGGAVSTLTSTPNGFTTIEVTDDNILFAVNSASSGAITTSAVILGYAPSDPLADANHQAVLVGPGAGWSSWVPQEITSTTLLDGMVVMIVTLGDTNFTTYGATATPFVGEVFTLNTVDRSTAGTGTVVIAGDSNSVGVGPAALAYMPYGHSNIAVGGNSLTYSQGNYNIALGEQSLSNLTGNHNIAIGHAAGMSIGAGSGNVIIGGYGGTNGMTNNIILADGGGTVRMQFDGTEWVSTDSWVYYGSLYMENELLCAGDPGGAGTMLISQGSALPPTWSNPSAIDILYDASASGFTATDVQGAIDEIAVGIQAILDNINGP